jgi:tetratricopeptide (TPR) repeat protein
VGIVLAGIAPQLPIYWPGERRSLTFNHVAVVLLLTILLGVLTHQRNYVWRNEVVLWEDAARKSPKKYRTHAELGDAYLRGAEYRKGAMAYQRALDLNPYHLLTDAPEKVKALWTEEEIARINPKNTLAESYHGGLHNNLGVAYSHLGRFAEALSEYEAAVSFAPLFVQARINLAKAYVRQGRPDDARSQLGEALRLDPSNNPASELLDELSQVGSDSP